MRCLVTGASGYVGRALVPALTAQGIEVCAPPRKSLPSGVTVLPAQGGDSVDGSWDLRDGGASLMLESIDAVIHLAGIAHQRADEAAYQAVNVDGSVALARRAAEAGVRRFIFVSSVKAAGHTPASLLRDAPLDYDRSKALAEAELQRLCASGPMALAVVRPALMYGGAMSGNLATLQRWVDLGLPRPPAGGERSMLARDDLVALLARMLVCSDPLPERVTVTDGERYSARRIYDALRQGASRRVFLPSPPAQLWRLALGGFDRIRGEAPGASWSRLAGEELYHRDDLSSLEFATRWTLETRLASIDGDAP